MMNLPPIAQGIKPRISNPLIQVRVLVGGPFMLHDLTKLKITKDKTLGYEVVYYPKHPLRKRKSGSRG